MRRMEEEGGEEEKRTKNEEFFLRIDDIWSKQICYTSSGHIQEVWSLVLIQ
jgi:hypothetical protein